MRRVVSVYLCAALVAQAALAAVPVVESTGTPVRGGTVSPQEPATVRAYPAASAPSSDEQPQPGGTGALFYQLQILQAEVRDLRGIVEEQAHRIEQLQQDQKEQYLDMDRRLSALAQVGGGAPTPRGGASVTSSPRGGGGAGEQSDYTAAYQLTVDKRFDDAIAAFNQFVADYPDGEYTGNAYYWLGELYLALPEADLERARQAFAQVVNQYPGHQKVPDALFKLGVVYHRLGDSPRALDYLTRVQNEHPGAMAARLAQSYAAEIR